MVQAEEDELRREVAAKAKSQASGGVELGMARWAQLAQQFEEAKAVLVDGRATAPEFAALRLSQKKGARELYALQVSGDVVVICGGQ
eukprot:Skav230593  [mRNA]  locus=scaffold3317:232327:235345:+ [translate_table: standard]